MEKFYCDGIRIRDSLGRERMFRGINVCIKTHSPERFLKIMDKITEKQSKKNSEMSFESIGANIIRFGITWAVVEPQRGKYNEEVISAVRDFINLCGKKGIYVMLDMHQDLFSHYFHGDGAPEWAVKGKYESHAPFAIWAEGYFYMQGVQNAFYDFWSDSDSLQTDFVKMWSHLTEELKDCSNIIGFDYLNEPYVHANGRKIFLNILSNVTRIVYNKNINYEKYFKPGKDKRGFALMSLKIASIIKTPGRLKKLLKTMDSYENFSEATKGLEKYTAEFNKNYYEPFFKKLCASAGREGKFNFFEHNYYSNLGVPFGIDASENDVYTPHAYDVFIDSPLYNKYSSNNRISVILDGIRENQLKMNVPVIFGEWGGGAPGSDWIEHIDYILNRFEKYRWSSIYWGYSFTEKRLERVFNRPYPVAVCGDITKIKTDSEKRSFTLEYTNSKDFENAETLIYIPEKGVVPYRAQKGENKIEISY